jgi:hypothetical protein
MPIVWFVGSIMVAVLSKSAPPSTHKRCMMVFLVLTPIVLVLFIVVMVSYGISGSPHYESSEQYERDSLNYASGLEATSGVLLAAYGLCGSLFIAFADVTFRSTQEPLTWSLSSPLVLRGVSLGLNLAGMFLLMPLFSFIGIPITLSNLRKIRSHSPGLFTASSVFGILSFITVVAIVLLLVIAGSIRVPYESFVDYKENCERAFVQQPDTTVDVMTNAMMTTTSAAVSAFSQTPTLFASRWPTDGAAPTSIVCDPEKIYETRYMSGLQEFPAWITLVSLTLVQWTFNFLFVGFADTLILKAIGNKSAAGGGIVSSELLVHPCPSCATPLQFARTGPTTQVHCYKCQSLVEFQTEA